MIAAKQSFLDVKPTRRITPSHLSVTGKKPSKKTGNTHRFESSLERDYITLLEFDERVDFYVEQPFTIHYLHEGKNRIYTPDFFVVYKPSVGTQPLLSEIKYKADLQRHQKDYRPKFTAAAQFAFANGYRFKVITEDEIRTDYLQNATFLSRYTQEEVDAEHASLLLTKLSALKEASPETLINQCNGNTHYKGGLLYTLWQLVAKKQIGCELNRPLTMNSKIWAPFSSK